jgi:hypothetical protein
MVHLALSPIWGGIIAGVVHTVLGPDHLSTIITLSACQGTEAFWFGVRWAGGHLAGMTLIGVVFGLLHASHGSAAVEAYEHYADYLIGVLLVSFGGYFLWRSDQYFDAEWGPKQKTCACHAHCIPGDVEAPPPSTGDRRPRRQGGRSERSPLREGAPQRHASFCGATKKCSKPNCDHNNCGEEAQNGQEQHLEGGSQEHDDGSRKAGSVLVGFVQGVACPAGIFGMAFLKHYTSAFQIVVFLTIFFVVTTLAMGSLAMAYGTLTQRCVSSAVLGRTIYCASCSLSLALGVAWIYLNATGRLDAIFGHDHDHDHNHAAHEANMLLLLAAPR